MRRFYIIYQKFSYIEGQPAEIFFDGEWRRGRIFAGYRFRDGIVTIITDNGEKIWCGEARKELYRPLQSQEYSFNSHFVDTCDTVLHINCTTIEGLYYDILIDTDDDPYKIYFSETTQFHQHIEKFRDNIFSYLKKEYPEHF